MNKIKLVFKGVSEIVGGDNLGLLVLTDGAETRQLTIVCDKQMEYQFGLRMKKLPIVNRLLPEVLVEMIATQTNIDFEVIIHDICDGQYQAMIVNKDTLQTIAMRASDAILLAYISEKPIYIEERLMMRQSVPYTAGTSGMTIPVNAISGDMLQLALDKAIEEENYELASHLHEELKRRKGNGDDSGGL